MFIFSRRNNEARGLLESATLVSYFFWPRTKRLIISWLERAFFSEGIMRQAGLLPQRPSLLTASEKNREPHYFFRKKCLFVPEKKQEPPYLFKRTSTDFFSEGIIMSHAGCILGEPSIMAFFCQNDIKKNLETWCSEGALTFSWVRKSGPTSFIQNILIHLWRNNNILLSEMQSLIHGLGC